ncbi:MAG: acetylglutamate kinase [Chloroflexi bacterium]|nr:acetylglutamate kinase [Chloroflexota bacterium]
MEREQVLAEVLGEALPYISNLAGKTIVVKLGGSALGSHDTTLEDVVGLTKLGVRAVLVHGGGTSISGWLRRIGKEPRFIDGLRVTDEDTMEIVTMVLAGKVNKDLVASLRALGGRSVGICGVDGGLIRARRISSDLGLVGDITHVDPQLLDLLFAAQHIPVVAPIALGEENESLNINADTAAAEIAVVSRAEKLVFLTDVAGICDARGELLSRLTVGEARALVVSGVISGGMIPKAEACCRALDGARATHIVDGRVPHALLRELFTDRGFGTMIVPT